MDRPPGETEVLEHEVFVEAPPEAVFDYFTDPAKLVRWMGQEAILDPRPGGVCRIAIGAATVRGEYVEVARPRRIVLRWGFDGDWVGARPSSTDVEVEFEPEATGTRVRLTHRRLPSGAVEFHRFGWSHFLSRLALAAAGGEPGPDGWTGHAQRLAGLDRREE